MDTPKQDVPVQPAIKTSRFAVVSITSAILGILSIALEIISLIVGKPIPSFNSFFGGDPFFVNRSLEMILFVIAFISGVIAVVLLSKKPMKGSGYATTGIILGCLFGFLISIAMFFVWDGRIYYAEVERANAGRDSIRQIGRATFRYAREHDGHLPVADQWCDLLMESDKSLTEDDFKHPMRLNRACNFAFNKNLSGLNLEDIAGNTVLLFEADGDWNLNGTAELLETEERKKKERVVFVLFVDGAYGKYFFPNIYFLEHDSDSLTYSPLRWKP